MANQIDLFGQDESPPPASRVPRATGQTLSSDSDASLARRQGSELYFKVPYKGPSGALLVGYLWPHSIIQTTDRRGEDKIVRVSDWSQAEVNPMTDRKIVHQFLVSQGGQEHLLSAESAAVALGVSQSTVRTNVLKIFANEIKERETIAKFWDEVNRLENGPWFATPAQALENADPPALAQVALQRAKSWGVAAKEYHERTGDSIRNSPTGGYSYVPSFVVGPKGYSSERLPWHPELSDEVDREHGWKSVMLRENEVWTVDGTDAYGPQIVPNETIEKNKYLRELIRTHKTAQGASELEHVKVLLGLVQDQRPDLLDLAAKLRESVRAFTRHYPAGPMTWAVLPANGITRAQEMSLGDPWPSDKYPAALAVWNILLKAPEIATQFAKGRPEISSPKVERGLEL